MALCHYIHMYNSDGSEAFGTLGVVYHSYQAKQKASMEQREFYDDLLLCLIISDHSCKSNASTTP
jgi:hypothetical protein